MSYKCSCKDGYIGFGNTKYKTSCFPDLCGNGSHTCHTDATCFNIIKEDLTRGFDCECNSGYDGDGFDCSGKAIYYYYIVITSICTLRS